MGQTSMRHRLLAALAALLFATSPASAQFDVPTDEGGRIWSLGQPPETYWGFGVTGGIHGRDDDRGVGYLVAGAQRYFLTSPVVGALALRGEGYGGVRGSALRADGGLRVLGAMPVFGLLAGLDYNLLDGQGDFLLGLEMHLRRGGVFGGGSALRIDWLPGRGGSFNVGFTAPFWQHAGQTRPRQTDARLEWHPVAGHLLEEPVEGIEPVVAQLQRDADRVRLLVMPFADPDEGDPARAMEPVVDNVLPLLAAPGEGTAQDRAVRAWVRTLEQLFGLAVRAGPGDTTGIAVARMARQVLLHDVLLPYDGLLGQRKSPDTSHEFEAVARSHLAQVVTASGLVPQSDLPRVFLAFDRLIDVIEEVRRQERDRWEDSRLVWLPLQLGLLPEEHDTQEEIEALVERAVGRDFTQGNRIWYLINEEFQLQVANSVHQAEDYHVLWIHDYRGRRDKDHPDALAFRQTLHGYMAALTNRVRDYDRTGTLPAYFIFFDQHYYVGNGGRLWMNLLEDPLRHRVSLPAGYEDWERQLDSAQAVLREAVASSTVLQARREIFGDEWMHDLVKVHVNITNPADQSFWASGILPLMGIPDNVMRDHRKIAFYDITEADPYRGMVMYTGMGVGEHYAGATWEDRAIMMQGPAALSMKRAAYTLLTRQGADPDQVPQVFRPRALPTDYWTTVAREVEASDDFGFPASEAIELHNDVGYGWKPISVVKAILYSLMPPGSVLKTPDSLWQNYLYASMLFGSALNTSRVLIVSPARSSAPSAGWPQLTRAHQLMSRLIVLQREVGPAIEAREGLFKVGIYREHVGVGNYPARIREGLAGAAKEPWLLRLSPLHPSVIAGLQQFADSLQEAAGLRYLTEAEGEVEPKLHVKGMFAASHEGWTRLVSRPEFRDVVLAYSAQRYRSVTRDAEAGPLDARALAEGVNRAAPPLLAAFRGALTDEEARRVVYFQQIGSANMDYRSMFIDGEVMLTTSGLGALAGVLDFMLLMAISEWVTTQEQLDALLPAPSSTQLKRARWLRSIL